MIFHCISLTYLILITAYLIFLSINIKTFITLETIDKHNLNSIAIGIKINHKINVIIWPKVFSGSFFSLFNINFLFNNLLNCYWVAYWVAIGLFELIFQWVFSKQYQPNLSIIRDRYLNILQPISEKIENKLFNSFNFFCLKKDIINCSCKSLYFNNNPI